MRQLRLILILSTLLAICPALTAQGIGGKGGHGGKGGFGGGPSAASGPTFLGTTECIATSALACTASSLSIPSGSIIVTVNSTVGALTASSSDSNGDTFTCTAGFANTTNANSIAGCAAKAGALITTVTCTKVTAINSNCEIQWYTTGGLAGTVDKTASVSEDPNTSWSAGPTSTLASSNELVVDMWADTNPGRTATFTDGTTQRATCSTVTSCAVSDKNVSSTAAVTSTGTPNIGNSFFVAAVMTIK